MLKRIALILSGLITTGFLAAGVADATPTAHTSATTVAAAPTDADGALDDVTGLLGHPVSL
ncbi:hypothetical protein AB0L75_43570 [Streptomyces sp. NPDC052101]|uniref:hypothetical protein n=1 Tax=Streptomyces sp. NPDC052101 TaxID=3155763 RepID=UPI00343630BA